MVKSGYATLTEIRQEWTIIDLMDALEVLRIERRSSEIIDSAMRPKEN